MAWRYGDGTLDRHRQETVCAQPPRARGRIIRAIRSLDDHWIGDLIGAVCLCGTILLLVIVVGVLS